MTTQLQLPRRQRPTTDRSATPVAPPVTIAPGIDDGLSPLRGILAGALLSLPVWAGVGVVTWRVLR